MGLMVRATPLSQRRCQGSLTALVPPARLGPAGGEECEVAGLVVDETEVQLRLSAVEHALGVHGNLSVARSALERAEVVSDPLARVHGFKVG